MQQPAWKPQAPVQEAVEASQPPLSPEQEVVIRLMRQHSLAQALRLYGKGKT